MKTNSKVDFPKVLLVGNFSWYSANGITVQNLFSLWPSDRLAIISTNIDDISIIFSEKIKRYYFLGKNETSVRKPFNLLFKTPITKQFYFKNFEDFKAIQNKHKKSSTDSKGRIPKILLSLRYGLIHFLGFSLQLKKRTISPELADWILNFSPQYIYCTTSNIDDIDFAISLKKRFGFSKLIFHTFDDFVHSSYQNTALPFYWKRKLKKKFCQLLENTDLNFTISKKMAIEYKGLFNKNFYPFHNPVDLNFWDTGEIQKKGVEGDPFVFVYAGKVNKDTHKSILKFFEALLEVRKAGYNIEFKIFSPYEIKTIKAFLGKTADKISIERHEYKLLPKKFSAADALLLPLNSNKRTFKYIRLSMLTKATEYMAIKRPIFLFTPKNVAVSEYLMENNAAYFLDSNSHPSEIKKAIIEFLKNQNLRREIVNNAFALCAKDHTVENVTKRLLDLLTYTKN